MNLKTLALTGAALLALATGLSAQTYPGAVALSGNITGTRTLSADTVYQINGTVKVMSGGLLSIAPGTLIVGNVDSVRACIQVERGGKIYAQGTPTAPIVFTSARAQGAKQPSDWGGIILLGYANINPASDTATIEGGTGGVYGCAPGEPCFSGMTQAQRDADSSGVLSYVRIEFGGEAFAPNNEINGLTQGGVGNRTKIDHVQVSYSDDDSFEWFGGLANGKYLISYASKDDDFDTDFGFNGHLQFIFAMRDSTKSDVSTSNGFEADNDATGSTNAPLSRPIISNATIVGPFRDTNATAGLFGRGGHWRRNTDYGLFNSVVTGFQEGIRIDGALVDANSNPQDSVRLQYTVVTGKSKVASAAGGAVQASVDTWYNAGTNTPTTNGGYDHSQAGLTAVTQSNLTNPDPRPTLSSPAATGTNYSDPYLAAANNFSFDSVSYKGAFNPNTGRAAQWDTTWTNYKPLTTTYVKYRAGWNLVALANTATDSSKSTVFPNSVSNASRFNNGYVTDNTLNPGVGYWTKLSDNRINAQEGTVRSLPQTVSVVAGWNLISTGASVRAQVSSATYSGTSRLTNFSGFSNGYFTATVLEPGRAYWVKMSAAGTITFN